MIRHLFLISLGVNFTSTHVARKAVKAQLTQVPLFYGENVNDLGLRFDTDTFQNVCGSVAAAYTGVPEVCLFFRNTLFRGNRTVKTNASEFDAFSSPNYPALGEVGIDFYLENDNVLHLPTTRRFFPGSSTPTHMPQARGSPGRARRGSST